VLGLTSGLFQASGPARTKSERLIMKEAKIKQLAVAQYSQGETLKAMALR
jgi:hypothetical protein